MKKQNTVTALVQRRLIYAHTRNVLLHDFLIRTSANGSRQGRSRGTTAGFRCAPPLALPRHG